MAAPGHLMQLALVHARRGTIPHGRLSLLCGRVHGGRSSSSRLLKKCFWRCLTEASSVFQVTLGCLLALTLGWLS